MPHFRYQAIDKTGARQTGVVEAESIDAANRQVFALGLSTLDLEEQSAPKNSASPQELLDRLFPLKPDDVILFTKQLVTTLRVGIPITQCLKALELQTTHRRIRSICKQLHAQVEQGNRLSTAMQQHPEAFSKMYCSIVAAGETSGMLPEVMDRLIFLVEHEAKVRGEVKSAMRYPVMVAGALLCAFVVIVAFVIPRFVGFFSQADLELPWPTRLCLWMSDTFQTHAVLIVLGVIGLFIGGRAFLGTERGQLILDRLLLRLPLIGDVLVKAAMTRFASIFAILQSSGVMVLESFKILAQTVGNRAIAEEFDQLGESLQEGRGIAGPLEDARYFPPLMVSMVAIGEETGQLDEMLGKISEHYDEELRIQMKKFSDAIGPVLIVSLTVVIGFFALAIYLPMWDLTQMAQQGKGN